MIDNRYFVNKFPDGQINVSIKSEIKHLNFKIKSYEDIAILSALSEVVYYNFGYKPKVRIAFMFGQRSDRRFYEEESIGLKIIADMINVIGLPEVAILDPHSHDTISLINNSKIWHPDKYIYQSWLDFQRFFCPTKKPYLVSPDAGAYKKVESIAKEFGAENIPGNKYRDSKGNIQLSFNGDVEGKNLLIIDDLADGGATFHYLAKKAKELRASKVGLYVTHGMFMKGLNNLDEYIDVIYTTDSYRDDFDSIQPNNNKNFFQVIKL